MTADALDHVVIHVHEWEATHAFYVGILGMQRVVNPEALGNPLDACAYRIGDVQINVHGPWPGRPDPCCPPPLNEPGRADLAFRSDRTTRDTVALLARNGIQASGPVRRFGAGGWGSSVYCHDPSGNGVELISYAEELGERTDP